MPLLEYLVRLPASLIALVSLACLLVLRWYSTRSKVVKMLPGPPSSTWLLGSLVDFYSPGGGNSVSIQWYKTYGSVCRFKGFLGRDHIQIGDPTAVAHLLNAGPYAYEKDTVEKPRFETMFGAGLLSANGEMHKKLRRIILPAFGTQQVNALAPVFERCALDIKSRWAQQIENAGGEANINLGMDCSFGLLNAIGEAAFGYQFDVFNKGPTTPLFQALASISSARSYYQLLLESFADRFPGWMVDVVLSLPIQNGRVLRRQLDVMRSTAADLFNAGLEDAQLYQQSRKDLLSVLVKANLESSPKFRLTAEEVQAQLMTFVMAGWGTVLSVLSNFIRQLAEHTAVQDRLRAELSSLGPVPTIEQLQRAPYLDAVLKESMRVVGVTPLERIATSDDFVPLSKPVQLSDGSFTTILPIKKGQSFSIPVQAMNFEEARFGPDAATFRPERWLGEEGEALRSYTGFGPGTWNGLHVPFVRRAPAMLIRSNRVNFGAGTRSCVGCVACA